MRNFQQFVKAWVQLKTDKSETLHRGANKKVYRDLVGLKTQEEIDEYEKEKDMKMNMYMKQCFKEIYYYGSIFQIGERIRRYVILNDPPDKKEIYKKLDLPFPTIFIETEFSNTDVNLGVSNIKGIMITQPEVKGTIYEDGKAFLVYYYNDDIVNTNGTLYHKFFIDEFLLYFGDNEKDNSIYYDDRKTLRFLKKFVTNFLLFINDPEVTFYKIKRGKKNRERRVRKGLMELPDNYNVRLIGKLKTYFNKIGDKLEGNYYNYSFWVRGHYRTFKDDRYTNMKGKTIKIEPFIKGEGVLLQRDYDVNIGKKDKRYKDTVKGRIFHKDIKPLNKPLSEIRKEGK